MKKILFLFAVIALAFITSCKEKEVPSPPTPPPPPSPMLSQQEYLKGLVSMIPQLEPGEVIPVKVDKEKVFSEESVFNVSLFPLEFISPAEKPYIMKYLFPSVVWRFTDSQLGVYDLPDYLDNAKPGEKFWILKDSPAGTLPFKQIPTLLVEASEGKFWVLDQKGDEMPLRVDWSK